MRFHFSTTVLFMLKPRGILLKGAVSMIVMMRVTKRVKVKSQQCTHNRPTLVQLRDPPSMPSSCVGMPSFITQYALNIKRRNSLKSVTHRAYGPYALCVLALAYKSQIY